MEPIGRLIKSEEIQEGKTRCPGTQEEGDEEGDAGEEDIRGEEARARSDGSDAALRKFRRRDRRSIDTAAAPASDASQVGATRLIEPSSTRVRCLKTPSQAQRSAA